jgi:hemoglobin
MASYYETLGGEFKVRAIIDTFVDRMTNDIMIGFFFNKVPIARLKELEFQHAAQFLGADIQYTGRPLPEAHRKHNIMGGQFARRKQILKEVLEEFAVPQNIGEAWLEHVESLRSEITAQAGSRCN